MFILLAVLLSNATVLLETEIEKGGRVVVLQHVTCDVRRSQAGK